MMSVIVLAAALITQPVCETGPQVDAVMHRRAVFNAAIASGELAPIADILTEDVMLRAGTSSTLIAGREPQLDVWGADFSDPDRLVYVRTPDCVSLSPLVDFAFEHGAWRGATVSDPDSGISGRYSAKWALQDGVWRLDAELYLSTACTGALCPSE